jgi:hypothetical protein
LLSRSSNRKKCPYCNKSLTPTNDESESNDETESRDETDDIIEQCKTLCSDWLNHNNICISNTEHNEPIEPESNDVHMNIEDPQLQPNTIQLYPDEEDIYEVEEVEEDEKVGCVDDIAKILIEKEVTMVDVLSYFDNRYNSRSPSHRHRNHACHNYYAEYMKQTIESAFNDVDSYASL